MKQFLLASILAAAIAVGCAPAGDAAPETSGTEPQTSAQMSPESSAPYAPGLGETRIVGHLGVTLSAEPEPAADVPTTFTATLRHGPETITSGDVRLVLTHAETGESQTVQMQATGDGAFTGEATLPSAGTWNANLEISAGHDTGTAAYRFDVN
jgi:hypothetical protein